MSISLLLEMAVSHDPDRLALVSEDLRLTTRQLSDLAAGGANVITESTAEHVIYLGTGGVMLPLLIFASARAGRTFTPVNYRLSADAIRALIQRLPDPLVVVDTRYREILAEVHPQVVTSEEFVVAARSPGPAEQPPVFPDPDAAAIVLFTSGTTATPKAVELSHTNLTSYITGTVEFASAQAGDAALICVPPYHIAGVSAALSNLYAGREMVYLPNFDAERWVRLVDDEHITTATVVPTMLDRIVAVLEHSEHSGGHRLPSLRNLAYGGSKVPLPLVRRALELLPHVGFVNAYGLTETSSTIAMLTPDDHRQAQHAIDPAIARRLGSVGRPVPGVEVQIRDDNGAVLAPGGTGELYVRGEQVCRRYTGVGSALDADGWFATRDLATLDEGGYLYLGGRTDDTVIRGGENIAPAELEDVMIEHPGVRDVAVVGVDDAQWGQALVAVVVPEAGVEPDPDELRDYVRKRLRASRTPDRVVFFGELPTNETGKVLRRQLVESLTPAKQ